MAVAQIQEHGGGRMNDEMPIHPYPNKVQDMDFLARKLKHEVKGLFDFHIQCDCVKGRWRPIWYLWFEDIHNKIFRKRDVQ